MLLQTEPQNNIIYELKKWTFKMFSISRRRKKEEGNPVNIPIAVRAMSHYVK